MPKKPRSRTLAADFTIDDQIGHVLRRAYQAASAHLARRLKPYDLTPQQFATLQRLRERGATPQNRLGEAVDMPRANIHKMVERLRERRLVAVRADPADARLRLVDLTAAGRRLAAELIPLDVASTQDALAPLSDAERDALYGLLRKIL